MNPRTWEEREADNARRETRRRDYWRFYELPLGDLEDIWHGDYQRQEDEAEACDALRDARDRKIDLGGEQP